MNKLTAPSAPRHRLAHATPVIACALWALLTLFAPALFAAPQAERRFDPAGAAPPATRAPETAPTTDVPPGSVEELSRGNRTFSFELLRQLRSEQPEENLFFSPYSISAALGMLYIGAEGETRRQMASTLRFESAGRHFLGASEQLHRRLTRRGAPGREGNATGDGDGDRFELTIANGIWAQVGYAFSPDYINSIHRAFDAEVSFPNFAGAPEAARETINEWVEDYTNEKIVDLLPQGSITPLTRMVLANAVYFNAGWVHPFQEGATAEAAFRTLEGAQRPVDLMQVQARLPVYRGAGTTAVSLPYVGDETSFIAFMPTDASDFDRWQEGLTVEMFDAVVENLAAQQAQVLLPRFSSEGSFGLPETLKALGMRDAFDPDVADFAGMTGGVASDLHVTDVLHKSVIEVDEEGTEAAAATAVIVGVRSVPADPVIIRFDRPFYYVIYDHPTDTVLFLGRMIHPA